MATIDGSIQLVKVVTDAELRQNGGSFVVAGRMAQPIQGFDTLTKRASGGNAISVYVVSDAQIANGTFRLKGGSALPMADIDVVAADVKTIQGAAIPVYVASGTLAGAGGAAVIEYLLRDEFTTDEAAPLTSPRTAEPGPGTLTITDSGNRLSILMGVLRFATTALADPRVYGPARARTAGRAAMVRLVTSGAGSDGFIWGWHTATTTYPQKGAFQKNSSTLQLIPNGVVGVLAASTEYLMAIIHRSPGMFYFIKGGAFAEWTLLFIDTALADATIYAGYAAATGSFDVDNITEIDLAAPFDSAYGLADVHEASVGVDGTIVHSADSWVESTHVAATGQTYELSVRRIDDNNRWIIRASNPTGTLKLIEVNAGVETERGTAAAGFSNGASYRILIMMQGNTISAYIGNTSRFLHYTSATFNNTATGAKTSHAVTNFIAWPRILSGAALAEINRP